MKRILIFGNSGSGKSTLAAKLSKAENLAHLDLDTLAWLPSNPPQRSPLEVSQKAIQEFTDKHQAWVVEGCYADLLELLATEATEIIFMNLPIELCVENARNRPWEPHKYASKQEQDENLAMLIDWIRQYDGRHDEFSLRAHKSLYDSFSGKKRMAASNE